MKEESLVLTFDCGTQSTRAMIFDSKGNMLAKEKISFTPYYSTQPGYAEQDPKLYWQKLVEASQQLKKDSPELWQRIEAVSLTTIRDTFVYLDKERNPVRDTILWLDQRKEDRFFAELPTSKKLTFKIVGMDEAVKQQMNKGHCNWLMYNDKENWKKIDKFVSLSCYLNYLLTGVLKDSDASNIGHVPFDYKNRRWYKQGSLNHYMFPIQTDKLCDLLPPSSIVGTVSKEASELTGIKEGLPVVLTGSDKACETIGTGCVGDGLASVSFGTTATVQITTEKYIEPQTFMPAYPSISPKRYNPEIQIYRGFWMVSWFVEQFASQEIAAAKAENRSVEWVLDEYLESVPTGSNGLILEPYWNPALKTPEARGAVIGFTDTHTRAHIYKAIIEGIGYGLYEGLKIMEKKAGYNIKALMVSGGGSSSNSVCQLTADISGLPVRRVQTYETSGLGAAMAAYVGIGKFKTIEDAIPSMVHDGEEFLPDMSKHEKYMKYFRVYTKMYKKLKPLYVEINSIEDELKKIDKE